MEREQILSQLRERMAAFAASRIESGAAEDLAQETMLLLHQKYGHVEAMEELLPLAFRIMRFKLAAHVRKRNRRGEDRAADITETPAADPGPGPEDALLAAETRAVLLKAFAALGERCRELLRLKLAGRGFEEIRQHFGAASINTVYTWDLRCRNQLKQSLRHMWGKEV
jgi:RNA polymerase sigma-70 factor, ECF subfamily